jgi:hypothetical protein
MREHAARIIGAAILISLGGCFHTGDASSVEAAGAEKPYDYVVHVRNTFGYRYNPEVSEDRVRLARQVVKPYCGNSQVVGENKFPTDVPGITSSRPDYVVYIRCERRMKQ